MPATNRTTYFMAVACIAVFAASILIPQTFQDPGGGFAAATSVAILFVGLAAFAAIFAIVLLVRSVVQRRYLSRAARIAGALPAAVIACCLVVLWLSIQNDT